MKVNIVQIAIRRLNLFYYNSSWVKNFVGHYHSGYSPSPSPSPSDIPINKHAATGNAATSHPPKTHIIPATTIAAAAAAPPGSRLGREGTGAGLPLSQPGLP